MSSNGPRLSTPELSAMVTLQRVIDRLTSFWQDRGCALIPPCSFEVPLGLLHPEAFFRLLDAEPWQAAFLQPISRPADGRGGRHPFRTARHLQLQVVLGGVDAAAPRQLIVDSLSAVGLDPRDHDLQLWDNRFEIEAAAVSGRGWRVVLDGLRLGRVTFLDQVAGHSIAHRAVEISYGVERLAMACTGASDVFSIPWQSAQATSGGRAKRLEPEEESFRYATEVAGVAYLRQTVDGLEREARRCLEAKLPRIAYELAVRMLPALDQLETRGDLSRRERRKWLAEVQDLVVGAGDLYRESLPSAAAEEMTPPARKGVASRLPEHPSPEDSGEKSTPKESSEPETLTSSASTESETNAVAEPDSAAEPAPAPASVPAGKAARKPRRRRRTPKTDPPQAGVENLEAAEAPKATKASKPKPARRSRSSASRPAGTRKRGKATD